MAKLPSFKRLYKADFPQQYQQLVDQMSFTINSGFESLYDALNNKLTFTDNFAGSIKDVIVTVDANGVPTSPTVFSVTTTGAIQGLQVIKAEPTQGSSFPSAGPFINYTQSGTTININHVTGLPPNIQYSIRVIAYGN